MLSVWLPLNGDLRNQGLFNLPASSFDTRIRYTNGKLGQYCYGDCAIYHIGQEWLGNTWSLACWVKSSNWGTYNDIILCKNTTSSSEAQFYFSIIGGSRLNIGCNAGSETLTASYTFAVNTWYHVAATYNGTTLKLYLNGNEIASKAYVSVQKTGMNNLGIGCRSQNADGTSATGQASKCMNDVRIYDHALSPLEVKHLAQGLVLHYPLNRGGFGGDNLFKVNCCSGGNRATFLENGKRVKINWTSNIGDTYWYLGLASGVTLTQGETYTLSFQCSGLGSNTVSFRWCNLVNYDVFLKNGLNTYTFQMPSRNITNPFFDDITRDANLSDLELWNFKLEKGSTATPWTPAPSDALYSQMGLDNNIEYDVSGYGNNGTRVGTFNWFGDTPRYNTSTYVNSSSSINHPRCLSNDDQEWTCCAWVKLDSSTSYQQLNNFNNGNEVVYGTTPILYLNDGSDDYYMYGSQIIPVDEWTHIAFVFKNSTGLRNIYINGILKNNHGPNKTSTPYGIPDSVTLFGQNFAGYVSDYREYATALSADDVYNLYAVGASLSNTGVLFSNEVSEV